MAAWLCVVFDEFDRLVRAVAATIVVPVVPLAHAIFDGVCTYDIVKHAVDVVETTRGVWRHGDACLEIPPGDQDQTGNGR